MNCSHASTSEAGRLMQTLLLKIYLGPCKQNVSEHYIHLTTDLHYCKRIMELYPLWPSRINVSSPPTPHSSFPIKPLLLLPSTALSLTLMVLIWTSELNKDLKPFDFTAWIVIMFSTCYVTHLPFLCSWKKWAGIYSRTLSHTQGSLPLSAFLERLLPEQFHTFVFAVGKDANPPASGQLISSKDTRHQLQPGTWLSQHQQNFSLFSDRACLSIFSTRLKAENQRSGFSALSTCHLRYTRICQWVWKIHTGNYSLVGICRKLTSSTNTGRFYMNFLSFLD